MYISDKHRFTTPMLIISFLAASGVACELLRSIPWAFAVIAVLAIPILYLADKIPPLPHPIAASWECARATLLLLHASVFLSSVTLPNTPLIFIAVAMFFSAGCFAASSIDSIARLSRFLLPALLVVFFLTFALRPASYELQRLPPFSMPTEGDMLKIFGVAIFTFVRVPILTKGNKGAKTAVLIGAPLLSLLLLIPILTLGTELTSVLRYPLYHAANVVVGRFGFFLVLLRITLVIFDAGLSFSHCMRRKSV